jgi:CDP-diacylglycerol--glycerol-3-phosphate 3-phosphatidyltransferase
MTEAAHPMPKPAAAATPAPVTAIDARPAAADNPTAMSQADQGLRAQVWNLPNVLTYARIAAVPVVVACVLGSHPALRWLALAIFVAAALTDFFDGYLARAWHQQSALGRMLDPIADKLLVSALLLAFAAEGTISGWSLWAALVILCREILVSGLREYLAELRVSLPVTQLAKWKTTGQLVAIGFLIAGPAGDRIVFGISQAGLALLWVSALITLYTGYDYFRAGMRHVFEDTP